ncbi:hypothetical protein ACFFWD_13225 [Bradyrhizobium erythrophlei]|uniref:hypothetical protein n=1 Tax=Bradyrhizobium erythrophlei TaxID=1437360 RepID=UPI0035E543B7
MDTILKRYKTDSQRTILMKTGAISFRDARLGWVSLGCVVLNISTSGAGLVVESDVEIPFAFDLAIETEPFRRHCFVVWRIDRRIGVTFDLDRIQCDRMQYGD